MSYTDFINLQNHNKFLLLFTIFWLIAFISLGVWQINRGLAKQEQESAIAEVLPPLTSIRQMLEVINGKTTDEAAIDMFFQPVQLSGVFQDRHFLLDNSIYYKMRSSETGSDKDPYCQLRGDCGRRIGQVEVGYRLFSVFVPNASLQPILVERGWLAAGNDRNQLPAVDRVTGLQNIEGIIMPQAGARRVLRPDLLSEDARVQRVQKLDFDRFTAELKLGDLYPYPIILAANSEAALEVFAPLPNLSYLNPVRHFSYAAQWFIMAVTLLIVYIIFYRRSNSIKISRGINDKKDKK